MRTNHREEHRDENSFSNLSWMEEKIKESKPLSREEEKELYLRIKKGDKAAKEQMLLANLKFLVFIANKYIRAGRCSLEIAELISLGSIGLMKAIEKWEPERGYRFTTYAYAWVRQVIEREIKKVDRMIRLPDHVFKDFFTVLKITDRLRQSLNSEPGIEDIYKASRLPWRRLVIVLNIINDNRILHFETSFCNDDSDTLHEIIANDTPTPEEIVEARNLRDFLLKQVQKLEDSIENYILCRRFGFNGKGGSAATYREIAADIAKEFNVKMTHEWVRQKEKKALLKLKKLLQNERGLLCANPLRYRKNPSVF